MKKRPRPKKTAGRRKVTGKARFRKALAIARKSTKKAAAPRKRKALAKVVAPENGKAPKTFRLVSGIPELPREGTSGRAILESIKARGLATVAEIKSDIPKSVAHLTLQKYLRMFEDGKIITSEAQA